MCRLCVAASCAILLLQIAVCQEGELPGRPTFVGEQDSVRRSLASISFDKSLNTYHWTGLTLIGAALGADSVRLREQYLSTLIRADRKLITDNQSLDLHIAHRLSTDVSAVARVSSFILSDNKGIGISDAASHAAYGGISYRLLDAITVEPMVGIRFDNQIDQHDHGISYLLGVNSGVLNSEGYLTRLGGSLQYDRLDPRILETHNASVTIEKAFAPGTRNQLRVSYFGNRRDFYSLASLAIQRENGIDYNIETRSDNTIGATDTLDYGISDRMSLTFGGNLLARSITRASRYRDLADPSQSPLNTSISELHLGGSVRAAYRLFDRVRTSLAFVYAERDERHDLQVDESLASFYADSLTRNEERKNNLAHQTSVVSTVAVGFSSSDSLALSGSGTLLRYDTPSADNTDDRDELWYVVNLSTLHHINRHLTLRLTADLSLTHLVYIYSAQSANNTWNRIARIAPSLEYVPSQHFRTTNSFEVLANYTVYDFEFSSALTKSFVFRQFAFVDSSSLDLTRRLGLEWFNYIRLYERGELAWDAFAERPVNYFEDKTYMGSVRYAMSDHLLFTVGIRYFSQERFGYTTGTERALESSLNSLGPTASIVLIVAGRTDLTVRGWYEHQSQTGQPDRNLTTMIMLLNVRI